MHLLIIGGTRFVGLAIARAAIARGHEVDLFHRTADVPAGTESARHLLGDRTRDFTALQTGEWDAVVDVCGYRPHEIHALYDVFAGRIQKYVFVSTVSVYDSAMPVGSDENAPFAATEFLAALDPITVPMSGRVYGPLKVLCEQAVMEHYPNHLIIRPTYVIGSDDYTDRFTKWVRQVEAGGVVDAPEPRSASMQYIDARDLADFVVHATEQDLQGAYNLATPSGGTTFEAVLETVREAVGDAAAELNWLPVEQALERSEDFPFYAGEHTVVPMRTVSTEKALAAGFAPRPLIESVKDLLR